MNDKTIQQPDNQENEPQGLDLLRAPFPAHQISRLPKPTKKQTDEVKADFKKGIRCAECGQWHHKDVVHLDYVGHAALTNRLLDCDPHWNWEPVAVDQFGIPMIDQNGGMWIRLTVLNQTRLGYGHAEGKRGGDAIKEIIGDALRNAAMRFGAALDLWHKGSLIAEQEDDGGVPPVTDEASEMAAFAKAVDDAKRAIARETEMDGLVALWQSFDRDVKADGGVIKCKDARKAELAPKPSADIGDDEIPY